MANKDSGGGALAILTTIATIATAAATIAPHVAPTVQPVADLFRDRTEKTENPHADWPEVPLVINTRLSVAEEKLLESNLRSLPRPVEPHVKYAHKKPDVIIGTSHKAYTRVRPNTLITLDYIPQEVLDESKQLALEAEERKEQARQKRRDRAVAMRARAKEAMPKKKPKLEE